MSRAKCITTIVCGMLLAALALPALAEDPPTPQRQAEHRKTHKKQAPPPLVLPPLPAGPLRQVPMDQIPETAPKVTYENGQLTILAQNATLGEILKQVRQLTGASIDLPAGGAPERVVTQIGPGAPRDVLAVLLNGSAFNYVMLGSSSDPTAIASVMLTPKPAGAGEGQPASPAPAYQQSAETMPPTPGGRMFPQGPFRQQMIGQNPQAQAQPQPEPAMSAAEDNADDSSDDKDDDADQPPQGQPGQAGQPDANQQEQQQGNNPNQPNAGPRTPEQILQMLRQGQQPPPNGLPGNQPNPNNPPQQ